MIAETAEAPQEFPVMLGVTAIAVQPKEILNVQRFNQF
jgi:hypothetical protein